MRLITKPEELVVGRQYFVRHKRTNEVFRHDYKGWFSGANFLNNYHTIECATPTAEDFDRLIRESGE